MFLLMPGVFLFCRQNLPSVHFAQLLDLCTNQSDECYQMAWYEFERRYRKVIFGRIRAHLRRWNAANNVSYVEEISSRVTERLLANECRALRTFKGRDNEGKFVSFLNIVCLHSANSYMIVEIKLNPVALENIVIPSEDKPAVSDELVRILRDKLGKTQKSQFYTERDILVLLLRFIAGFKSKEVAQVPLLRFPKDNDHNVDIIVHRLCKTISEKK